MYSVVPYHLTLTLYLSVCRLVLYYLGFISPVSMSLCNLVLYTLVLLVLL